MKPTAKPRVSKSCTSCHEPDRAFADGRAVAVGIGNRPGRQNAPTLVNRGYGRLSFRDGRSASLEDQVTSGLAATYDPS